MIETRESNKSNSSIIKKFFFRQEVVDKTTVVEIEEVEISTVEKVKVGHQVIILRLSE